MTFIDAGSSKLTRRWLNIIQNYYGNTNCTNAYFNR